MDQQIISVNAQIVGGNSSFQVKEDKMSILIGFADGSIGTVHYFANGSKRFPKERVEVFSAGRILVLDNFKKLVGFGFKRFHKMKTFSQEKGHREEVQAFLNRVENGGELLISWDVMESVTLATFEALEKAKKITNLTPLA